MTKGRRIALIVVAVLVLGVFAGLQVLDSVLTAKAQAQAETLTAQLHRPVRIGSVATKLLTGLGVRVSEVSIGAGPGEELPLLTLKRVEVKVALLKALFSGGKDVDVRSAEIQGLTVNVIKLPDGTTNLERLQQELAAQAKADARPEANPAAKKESDLSFLRVDHAELSEGRIAFVDRSGKSERDLAISHLDLRLDDLRAGQPLEVVLKAAVLGEQQNFELHLKAAPLPKSLVPTPETISLKVSPLDLAPLGPFAGKAVGLEAGKLDADFSAQLGAAVPGGTGPTKLLGVVHALGLRFAGADGGKPLDVVLDVDVKGDAAQGDVQIDKLRLDFGPAGFSGHGSAKGLSTPAPQIEGLEIVSHDLDPAKLTALYPPLRKLLNGEIAGPVGISLHAAGGKEAQALELKIDLTPVRLAVPKALTKTAGAAMTLTAHVRGAAATGGPLRFDLQAELRGVDLRPGGSLNKAPDEALDLLVQGTRTANAKAAEQRIELENVKLHLLGDAIDGKGFVELKGAGAKKTTQFGLQLASAHLDLDKLLLPSQKEEKEEAPLDPKTFAGLSGTAELRIDALRLKLGTARADFKNILASVKVTEDEAFVEKAQLEAFNGLISAAGTKLKLAHPKEPFAAKLTLKGIDLASAAQMATTKKVIGGRFSGDIDLTGGGQEKAELAKTLAGALAGHLLDGVFYGKDLIASVSGPLAKALPFGLAGKTGEGGSTSLGKDLPVGLTFDKGVARLKAPLVVSTAQGQLSFTGGIRVDGELDLPGTISLSPQTISELTGGKLKPSAPVPVGLRLTGPATSPNVTDLDLKGAVSTLLKDGGAALLGKALGTDKAQAAVEDRARQVEADAKKKAQDVAEQEKQKLENEAQDKLKGLFGGH